MTKIKIGSGHSDAQICKDQKKIKKQKQENQFLNPVFQFGKKPHNEN